mgnify:CR=1 FL=1
MCSTFCFDKIKLGYDKNKKQKEFEIVETLSKEYSIKLLCEIMNISRSGYYKWLKNKDILNNYEINRRDLGELIKDIHKRKPSYECIE